MQHHVLSIGDVLSEDFRVVVEDVVDVRVEGSPCADDLPSWHLADDISLVDVLSRHHSGIPVASLSEQDWVLDLWVGHSYFLVMGKVLVPVLLVLGRGLFTEPLWVDLVVWEGLIDALNVVIKLQE